MAYTKQTWADLPSKTTPINAERLTHIEDGIFNAAQTADTAASTAGTAAANVGIVSGRVETLTGRVNDLDTAVSNKVDKVTGKGLSTNDYDDTDKGKVDSLGTASTKNSTSVVTESTDLVESGAVCRAIGIDFKNLIGIKGGWSGQGVIEPTVNAIRSDKFAVNEGDTFIASKKSALTSNWSIIFAILFDGSGTFIRQENILGYDTLVGTPFTIPSGVGYVAFSLYLNVNDFANITAFEIQVEHGSTATAYEPYHASVSDSLAEKCDNSVIGTVEDGTNPTKSYAVDEFMVRDGAFCQVTAPVTTSSTWTEGSNYTKKSIAEVIQSLMS